MTYIPAVFFTHGFKSRNRKLLQLRLYLLLRGGTALDISFSSLHTALVLLFMLSSANQDSGGIQFSKVKSSFMTCLGQEFSCQTILYKSSYYFTFPSTTYSSAFLSELIIESERPLSQIIPHHLNMPLELQGN